MKQLVKRMFPQSVRFRARRGERALRQWTSSRAVKLLGRIPNAQEDLATTLYERTPITPEAVILGYAQGMFLAPELNGPLRWHDPDIRGVIPLEDVHVPKSLRSVLNKKKFDIGFDTDFAGVLAGCAAPAPGREITWLTPQLQALLLELHALGVAHSVEAYQNGELVGGLYGIAINGYFSGNSMFYRVSDASKVAFMYQVEMMRRNNYRLLDSWWLAPSLQKFGQIAIPRAEFRVRLARALLTPATFDAPDDIEVNHQDYN
ncbi:MAG: leucyl/phenylalanyl-tRNA--protein transferase [Anaerolineae bacterium]|nr:leucyl/phenylalanyl-tRNA--protein transferase [Anaerolineae bacterium]